MYREGRYFARKVVPPALRPFLNGKTELRVPLGPDRRNALRKHPMAVAEITAKIELARQQEAQARGVAVEPGQYPLSDAQIALRSYQDRLRQDETARNSLPGYSTISIDDGFVAEIRSGIAGSLTDPELNNLVGHRIAEFRRRGNTTAEIGSEEWRRLARSLCVAELESLARMYERDEGNYTGTPEHPLLATAEVEEQQPEPVSLQGLFGDYIASRKVLGKGAEAEKRWTPVFEHLRKYLRHDDARRIVKKDLIGWRDALLQEKSAKTVASVYLASVRTVLGWAVNEDRLPSNPAKDVRQDVPKATRNREQGFTNAEATAIIRHTVSYEPQPFNGNAPREFPKTTAAKNWVPLLCAHTGARVTEITQLRKQDVQHEDGVSFIRISPDAGTVKTDQYRDVPLHKQLVDMGFLDFVAASGTGPLFFTPKDGKPHLESARIISNRIGAWLKSRDLVPNGVSPNHGWRHRFKTVAREVGASDRVTDAICGHAGRTAGENYGDVTLKAKARVVDALPDYDLN
ncbi:hypothetical protein AVJ23_01400 [Pseudoponticoccus marisrubri]|uniref:Tyr recombinase domain-containing protein n=1 Tax=Pseudoponticoccus marisrubri TaxID=1685382 RepID=A0A0W7WQM1_9RHOB|nr:hypothetical protein AVJ23_01400 [Pseudoponticoccus marisrubri]